MKRPFKNRLSAINWTADQDYSLLYVNPENEFNLNNGNYVSQGDLTGAEQSFKSIPATSDQYDTATWYLGLSYLRQNKIEAAKSELQKLADGTLSTGTKRKALAKELLERL